MPYIHLRILRLVSVYLFVLMSTLIYATIDMPLTVTPGNAQITLSWGPVGSGGPYYYLLEKKGANGTPVYQHTIYTTWSGGSYIDTAIQNSYAYNYRISAYPQQSPWDI